MSLAHAQVIAQSATASPGTQEGRHADEPDRAVGVRSLHRQCGWDRRAQAPAERRVRIQRIVRARRQERACSRRSATAPGNRMCSARASTAPASSPSSPDPAVDDAAVLSPDGTRLAFVSTRNGYRANIWVLDLKSGQMRNLTGAEEVQGDPAGPNGFFRPAWSPDGQWLAFSSDRNTDWRGHSGGHGWEHTQELSIYVIRADGQGFRRIASKPATPRLAQVVARRQARRLLRSDHRRHLGRAPAEPGRQGRVADRFGRRGDRRADRAHHRARG